MPGPVTPPPMPTPPTPAPPTPHLPPTPEDGIVGDDIGVEVPPEPPPKPPPPEDPTDGDVGFRVARPGGALRVFRDSSDPSGKRLIVVMVGNPTIWRPAHTTTDDAGNPQQVDALTVKANNMVVWVDGTAFRGLEAFVERDQDNEAGSPPEPPAFQDGASVVPRALLGVYAEGAVELSFGEQRYTATELYVDPHRFQALMVEPRFTGRTKGDETLGDAPLNLFVRARRARLIRRGFTVFDDAEVSTSQSDDRLVLRVVSLTVEEFAARVGEDGREVPHFLGYQSASTQRYGARTITVHGERLPLMWAPELHFGGSEGGSGFPTLFEGARLVNQNHLGRGAFLKFGTDVGPADGPWFHVSSEVGGYTERGPAGGLEIKWSHLDPEAPIRSLGTIDSWIVSEQGTDRDGFVPPDVRYRIVSESRTFIGDELTFDLGFATFSDRGFNPEFFERNHLQHKDRESYGRLRWEPEQPGNIVATLTTKWHQRPFVTETGMLPAAGVWAASVPVLTPHRRGGLGIDLTSTSHAGYFERFHDEALAVPDYRAWRLYSDTRLHAAMDAGDVRLGAFGGVVGARYLDVSAGPDESIARTAAVMGAQADLQLHRTYAARGGWFELDGLRHVVDVGGGYEGRIGDRASLDDIPFFDRFDLERDHQSFFLRLRNRLQTRRTQGTGTRNVLDLEVTFHRYLDDIGPFGTTTPGAFEWQASGELRHGLSVLGEGVIDLDGGVQRNFVSASLKTVLAGRPLTWSPGIRFVRDRVWALTSDVQWRFNDRYQFEVLAHVDLDVGQSVYRVLARRYSLDHAIALGASYRDDSDGLQFEIFLEPAIGGRSESSVQKSDFWTFGEDPFAGGAR